MRDSFKIPDALKFHFVSRFRLRRSVERFRLPEQHKPSLTLYWLGELPAQ
jgi:hypothetical protein